jgi:hypothetical protein
MSRIYFSRLSSAILAALVLALILPRLAAAHDPEYTSTFDRQRCTFATAGTNPYFPLWPGYALVLEGEEEDDEGGTVELVVAITVTTDTQVVDGVRTRVVEERESEDGELVEVSRNFFALCRETGDLWYFGEDVDDYEDGEIVGHGGGWRAGVADAVPGILMPGTPFIGARFFQENAPGEAQDIGEVVSLTESLDLPFGSFDNLLYVEEGSALDPDDHSEKWYAHGIGLVKDEEIELVQVVLPPCQPGDTVLCLNDGRFRVEVEWAAFTPGDEGVGHVVLPGDDSGEFWFFAANNTELLVKVLDACNQPGFNSYWVFAAGLTNVEVTLTVTDTRSGQVRTYENDLGSPFAPILDTAAFATCP